MMMILGRLRYKRLVARAVLSENNFAKNWLSLKKTIGIQLKHLASAT